MTTKQLPGKLTRRKTLAIGAAAAASVAVARPALATGTTPESTRPIVFDMLEWTGQHITTKIAGNIIQDMGYSVTYATVGNYASAISLSEGQLSAVLEIWANDTGQYWRRLMKEGKVVNAGNLELNAREGWLYPKFVEQMAPGLPAWDALIKYHEIFATPDTMPKGRLLAYPEDWGHCSADIIRETGIPFEAVPAGSEGSLVAELNSSVERQAPLVMMFWSPHWVLSTVEHGWIEIPAKIARNHHLNHIPIWKMVWPGFEETWPAAYRFLQRYQIHDREREEMIALVDQKGMSLDKVTWDWVEQNQDVWQPWVNAALASA